MLVVPTVKGAPFSAQIRAEWVGPIPGAGQVVRSNTASVLRDSAGRVRQEHWTWARSNGSTQPPELLYVTFMDPVKAIGARCVTKERVCTLRPLDVAHSSWAQAGLLPTGKLGGSSIDNIYNVHEDLGTSVMEGVTTIGYKDTQTFTARRDPNPADPRVVAHTHWFSLDLGFDLQMDIIEYLYQSPQIPRSETKTAGYGCSISKSGDKLPALGRGNEACVGSIENSGRVNLARSIHYEFQHLV